MSDAWQLKAVISANAAGMIKTLGDVSKMAKGTRKYLADVANSAGNLGGKIGLPLAAVGGLVSGLSVVGIKNAVVGFTQMGEAVQKGALKAGMSVEQYQRMKYVAEQSGTSIEAMEGSLGKLNRTMGEAAAGKNKQVANLMAHLSINMRDANGNIRSGVDLLPQLAEAFKKNENPTARARLGMALFGRSYAEILPLLAEGAESIESNIQRFDRLKGVLDKGDINSAKELGDRFKDLDLVMKGFQGTVAKELAPVLGPLIKQLTDWWVVNKKLVSAKVAEMAKDLAKWVNTIDFGKLVADTGAFFTGLGKLVDMIGGAKNALIALVVVMNIQTIVAVTGLIGSIGRLGLGLATMTAQATLGAGGMATLTAAMGTAQTVGLGLLAVLGKLAAAAAVGYVVGTAVNYAINFAVEKLTGEKGQTLGGWVYDKLHPDEAETNRPSLVQQAKGRVDGQVNINIAGLPPGSRVEQVASGGNMPIDLSAGYSSTALGMP